MQPNIQVFTPIIALLRDSSLNTNTLITITYVPTSCYSGGEIALGHPPGLVTSPEVLAVTARLDRQSDDLCLLYLKPIVQSLQIPDSTLERRTQITTFVMVGDNIVGSQTMKLCPARRQAAMEAAKAGSERPVIACDGGFPWSPIAGC